MAATMIKKASKHLNFTQMLARVKKHKEAANLLKGSEQSKWQWLSDGEFLISLTSDKEKQKVKEAYLAVDSKNVPAVALDKMLPSEVGYIVNEVKMDRDGQKVRLSTVHSEVVIDAVLFETLKRRYGKAMVYLSKNTGLVIFSERKTVGLLAVQSLK